MSTTLKVKLNISDKMKDEHGNPIKIWMHDYYYTSQENKDKDSSTAYRECVTSRVVCPSPFDFHTEDPNSSVETKGSGSCAFDDSKWALYIWDNDSAINSGNIGYVHFKEKCGTGEWKSPDVGSYGNYSVTVDMEDHRTAKVTIQLLA